MDLDTTIKYSQILGNTSQFLLLVIGSVGLYQLVLTKQETIVRSKREAATLAASQCEKYADTILPLITALSREFKDHKFPLYDSACDEFTNQELRKWDKYREFLTSMSFLIKNDHFRDNLNILTNKLEAYATFFVNGVADEEIGFLTTGYSYCKIVKKLYPILAFNREEGYRENTISLYKLWSSRTERANLEKELKSAKEKLSTIKIKKVKSLGT